MADDTQHSRDAKPQREQQQSSPIPEALEPLILPAELDRIYDLRRNCQLNELYYGRRLTRFRRLALALEVTIVLGSGASGISGWVIWTTAPHLGLVWGGVAALSTALAAVKPAVQIDKTVSRYSALFSGYRDLSIASSEVVEDIAQRHRITPETNRDIARIRERYRKLAEDDDPRPSTRLIMRLQEEVNQRTPVDSLWYPQPRKTSPDRP